MIYREYGKTGKKVSAIGFGGMRFEEPNNTEGSAELLVHAFEKGINYFDTAPFYFKGKSEKIFGAAVPELRKAGGDFYLSTKSMAKDRDGLRLDLEKSLERLGVDKVDFYHVWCVLSPDDYAKRKAAGVIDEFRRIKEEGLADHICISTHMGGDEIAGLLGEEEYEGITLGYSAINFPFREAGLAAAAEKNMGVVIMNPLGGGAIADNPDAFSFIRMRSEQSIIEAALHFLLSSRSISSALVGFGNRRHIDEAAAAVETLVPYTESEIGLLKDRIQNDFQNMCTTCGYCKVCPEDIQVWAFMESYNHQIMNSQYSAEDRLHWHWDVSPEELERCTRCGRCEDACTQHLPILERFDELREMFRKK